MKKYIMLLTICMITETFYAPIASAVSPEKPVHSFAALPASVRNQKFKDVQSGFEYRWNLFLKGRHFHAYEPNKPKKDIIEEFKELSLSRLNSWYEDPQAKHLVSRADFMVAQEILEKGLYRNPLLIAFQYNCTDATYNSSSIILNGQSFLALEAPTEKTLAHFYRLLQNFQVTDLVRLTKESENQENKSFPYWKNNIKTNANKVTLQIPRGQASPYVVNYFALDTWLDDQGISPRALKDLILSIKNKSKKDGLIAIHCTNGVGKTGTLIAGFLLLSEIDKQLGSNIKPNTLDISIEKIVMQLSLQRPYMVATAEQYVTLYRLVDLYIETFKSIDN